MNTTNGGQVISSRQYIDPSSPQIFSLVDSRYNIYIANARVIDVDVGTGKAKYQILRLGQNQVKSNWAFKSLNGGIIRQITFGERQNVIYCFAEENGIG